ncbi:NUDIX hydrolase [Kribbella monticola]|uniref:NUDIX hydrolase n=1 Tax=Kribbella monticola TaxID=2185285 RepID=UPI000DD36271|nr:NUDIX hydrolase [Kribbella monticola]
MFRRTGHTPSQRPHSHLAERGDHSNTDTPPVRRYTRTHRRACRRQRHDRPEYWTLPSGGIEPGEDPTDAIQR